MREYAIVSPKFWTGETGRQLRRLGPEVQVVALYLITAPGANMLGLYYLPLPTLCHETGIPSEGASKALRSLSEGEFAHYDPVSEVVWVPEMAAYQIGATLSPKDNRHKAVVRELNAYRKCRFFKDFHARYKAAFSLPEPSPSEGASKPLRSQDQDQDQEQDGNAAPCADRPNVIPLTGKSPGKGSRRGPGAAKKPRAANPLFDALAEVTGSDPVVDGSHVGKVTALLSKADPPYTPDEVRAFAKAWREVLPWAKPTEHPRLTLGIIEKHVSQFRVWKRDRANALVTGGAFSPPPDFDSFPPRAAS